MIDNEPTFIIRLYIVNGFVFNYLKTFQLLSSLLTNNYISIQVNVSAIHRVKI